MISASQSGKTSLSLAILARLSPDMRVIIIDSKSRDETLKPIPGGNWQRWPTQHR